MTRKTSPLPKADIERNKVAAIRPLTPKEKAVLEFVQFQIASSGVSPSYQEIKDHFGLASFNSVQNYLKQLSNKGYIQIPANQKRAIQILHSADKAKEDLKQFSTTGPQNMLLQAQIEALSLPLLGRVAAGRPIERFENDEFVTVPGNMVKKAGSTFALRVEGDSMIDDGIWDGDLILVQKQTNAQNGDIVVASVDNESTVKRFYLKSTPQGSFDELMVELRPANPRLKSMWYSPHEVEIKGLVVGLLRQY